MRCSFCNAPMEMGETFCGECGRQTEKSQVNQPPPNINSAAAAQQAVSACAYCGTMLTAGKQFCGSCGKPVAAVPPPACPSCGARLAPGKHFCEDCGTSVEARPFAAAPVWPQAPMPPPMAPQSRANSRLLIGIVVLVVLAALGYVAYRFISTSSPNTPTEAVKAFLTAMANDDREGLKKLVTKKAFIDLNDGMDSMSHPVPEEQRSLARSTLAAGFRNETINGDKATIEAKIGDTWESVELVKEDGKWKINGGGGGGH